jgi:hypothetical protein
MNNFLMIIYCIEYCDKYLTNHGKKRETITVFDVEEFLKWSEMQGNYYHFRDKLDELLKVV